MKKALSCLLALVYLMTVWAALPCAAETAPAQIPAWFAPDVENAQKCDGMPEELQDAKFIVIFDRFETDDTLISRTIPEEFSSRLPENNRAASADEAGAALYIRQYYSLRRDYFGTAYNCVYVLYAVSADSGVTYSIGGTFTEPPYSGIGILTGYSLSEEELWQRFEPRICSKPLIVEYPEGTAVFRITEGGCCMTGLNGSFKEFTVPQEVEGRRVIGIEKIKNSNLEKLVLPEGLEWISGNHAIDCYRLRDIHFPSTLKRITGKDVFYLNCALVSYQYELWPETTGLPVLELNEGLEEIGEDTIPGSMALKSITIPSTVTSIGAGFLKYGISSTWLILPEGLTKLPGSFLSNDTGCQECVYLPGTMTDFPGIIYSSLRSTRIYTPAGSPAEEWAQKLGLTVVPCACADDMPRPEMMQEGSFIYTVLDGEAILIKYTANEKAITVPDTLGGFPVRVIKRMAFNRSYLTETLIFPAHIRLMEEECVYNCSSLKTLIIPGTVEQTGDPFITKCSGCTVYSPADSVIRTVAENNRIPWEEYIPQ